MNPENIQAIGVAIAAVIGAWTAWQGHQLRKLRTEVDALREQVGAITSKYRLAALTLRGWLKWNDSGRHGSPPPTPPELAEDVW